MSHDEFIAAILADSAALLDAAERAGLDAPVPPCPRWTTSDLVRHVGRTHQWATLTVTRHAEEAISSDELDDPPDGPPRIAWARARADELARELASAPPDQPVWAWGADKHVRFWSRRMAHETVVHRWDAQTAAGAQQPIDMTLAIDGIDELLENIQFRPSPPKFDLQGETIHLHCTDADGEWLVRLDRGGVDVTHEHAKGDVAARGSASDLLLLLCCRVPLSSVEVFGDSALLDRWQERAKF